MPGHVKARIYPLTGPDLEKARALANGNRRSGKAVLYTLDNPVDLAQAEILKQNLAAIGIESRSNASRSLSCSRSWRRPASRSISAGSTGVASSTPASSDSCSTGGGSATRTLGTGRTSIRRASIASSITRQLPLGPKRDRAYGQIDVELSRAAPAVPYGVPSAFTLVSSRVGCVVVNPALDFTAVCLK